MRRAGHAGGLDKVGILNGVRLLQERTGRRHGNEGMVSKDAAHPAVRYPRTDHGLLPNGANSQSPHTRAHAADGLLPYAVQHSGTDRLHYHHQGKARALRVAARSSLCNAKFVWSKRLSVYDPMKICRVTHFDKYSKV